MQIYWNHLSNTYDKQIHAAAAAVVAFSSIILTTLQSVGLNIKWIDENEEE